MSLSGRKPEPKILGGGATRREVIQKMLAAIGVGIGHPILATTHPSGRRLIDSAILEQVDARTAANGWKPEFLNPKQDQALIAIAERMLPGSTQARVSRIIDLLLSVDISANQKSFLASLSAFNDEAHQRYGTEFAELTPQQQDALLTAASGGTESDSNTSSDDPDDIGPAKIPVTLRDHFENLKGWIVGAFYATEPGMRELGWTEDFYFEELPACQHGSEHSADTNTSTSTITEEPTRPYQDGF